MDYPNPVNMGCSYLFGLCYNGKIALHSKSQNIIIKMRKWLKCQTILACYPIEYVLQKTLTSITKLRPQITHINPAKYY